MSDFPSTIPDSLSIGDYRILFVRFQPILNTGLVAALVVIKPSTTNMSPDIVVGLGRGEPEAKADAFKTAKEQIKANTPRDQD